MESRPESPPQEQGQREGERERGGRGTTFLLPWAGGEEGPLSAKACRSL